MTETFNRVRLSDVARIRHGFAFEGTYFVDRPTNYVLLTPGNFRVGGGLKIDKLKFYDGPIPDQYVLSPGELVVTMTDLSKNMDTLGYPALVSELPEGRIALHNQRIGLVEVISPAVDKNWLFYRLRVSDYRSEVLASSSGTTVHHTSPSRIEKFEFVLPPIEEQRTVAATLGALDDKIESNRRSIDKAQDLADALFLAKSGEPRAIADVATITMGSSPKGETLNEAGEGTPFYQGTRDFGLRFPSLRIWTVNPVRGAKRNDTLMAVRAPVGELNRAASDCCIGRGVAALHSDSHPSTLYYAMRASGSTWDKFQGEGTVFASVNKKNVHESEILWVQDDKAIHLEEELCALDLRIESLDAEIQNLTTLRDSLLPELLSGRILASTEGAIA